MRKKKRISILSWVIVVMMLFPQLPTRALTNLDVNTEDSNVINEDKKVDEVIKTEPNNSDSKDITIVDDEKKENNKSSQDSSIEIQDELIDDKTNESNKDKSSENKELVGEVYEQKNSMSTYSSFEPQVYEREEFNLKQESFNEVEELETKTDSNYEIALAHSDGTYTYVDSAENIEEAIDKVEEVSTGEVSTNGQAVRALAKSYSVVSLNSTNSGNEAIPVILNSDGRVVSSNKSMGRILKHINGQVYGYFDKNTNVYSSSSMTSAFTYINQGYVDDVPIIEDNGKSAKILVNGYQGWVNRDVNSSEYDMIIVPINQVTNPSYYFSENGILKHFISSNLRSDSRIGTTLEVGVAPSYLNDGVRYLSYDGNYFYDGSNITNGLDKLITDLQNNNYANAINSNNPYYNYYNYLPFRSTTTHNAADLDRFIASNTTEQDASKLRNSASAFIDAQNKYGVNALLALGVAINESNWGKSYIAREKNNIFGINAVDSSPGQSADSYATVADSIYEFAKNQISRAYADPANWAYYGGHLGNKKLGANVKYASDPFWGEKASQFAFKADYFISGSNINNLKDYNNFQLGIFTSPTQVKDSSGQLLYNVIDNFTQYAGFVGTSVVINSYNEGNYAINPERNTPVNTGGASNKYHGNYNFSDKGYVNSSSIMFINIKKPSNTTNSWVNIDGKYYYYDSNGNKCTGWLTLDGKKYYLDKTTGILQTGWFMENGYWYYSDNSGVVLTGLQQIGIHLYLFNESGVMQTGWQLVNGTWYYFHGSGDAKKGWFNQGNVWYYLADNGAMLTGLQQVGEHKYLFSGSGAMQTGWQLVNGTWYYFNGSGDAKKGWFNQGSVWYYLDDSCAMLTGLQQIGAHKYLFSGSGAMQTGWQLVNGNWYYFNGSGDAKKGWFKQGSVTYFLKDDCTMATGWLEISGQKYYFNSSGALVN